MVSRDVLEFFSYKHQHFFLSNNYTVQNNVYRNNYGSNSGRVRPSLINFSGIIYNYRERE